MRSCAAIVLAAGASTRIPGTNKLLVELDGKPLLAHVLENISAQDFAETHVVTRPGDNDVIQLAHRFFNRKSIRIIN